MRFRCLLALCLVLAPSCAQEPAPGRNPSSVLPMDDLLDHLEEDLDAPATPSTGSQVDLDIACGSIDDGETRTRCWKAYQARLSYYEEGLQRRARVIAWQNFSTRVIFFVVLGLVLVGVILAWLQFRQGYQLQRAAGRGGQAPAAGGGADHHVEISAQGIKVSSPVLGVVILTLSLAFFYLYLVFVYPITEVL